MLLGGRPRGGTIVKAIRALLAEALGTGILVFFGVGTATLTFGFGTAGGSIAAGVVATSLAFGLVLLALVYGIGAVSGCHVNPAVTLGFLAARRISLLEASGYWIAQLIGGIAGAAALYGIFRSTPLYTAHTGLGANGFGSHSIIGASAAGAFAAEVVLTGMFVFVVLSVTWQAANAPVAGLAIGLALAVVHLAGIPIDGTSVNPARSLASAVFAGGGALGQVWVFIVAPLVGAVLAAGLHALLRPAMSDASVIAPADVDIEAQGEDGHDPDAAVPAPREAGTAPGDTAPGKAAPAAGSAPESGP